MTSPQDAWQSFFVAQVGAAAALCGLVFVAVSISLQKILPSKHLRGRAMETLLVFFAVLTIATCGLIPSQGATALGLEIATVGVLVAVTAACRHLHAWRDRELPADARRWLWLRAVGAQASSLPFVVAGLLLVLGSERALVWLAPGVIAAFGVGALNAWVLLVEIQR